MPKDSTRSFIDRFRATVLMVGIRLKCESEMLQTVISLSISLTADVGKQTMYDVVNTFLFFLYMNSLLISGN